jgi:hypothetical protein
LSFFPICTEGGMAQAGEIERRVIGMTHRPFIWSAGEERDQKVREGLKKGFTNRIFPITALSDPTVKERSYVDGSDASAGLIRRTKKMRWRGYLVWLARLTFLIYRIENRIDFF